MEYKGHEIPKFFQGDGKWVPSTVIADYYRNEKSRIDRLIIIAEAKSKNT